MAKNLDYKVNVDTNDASDGVEDLTGSLAAMGLPIGALAGAWGKVTAALGLATKGMKSFRLALISTGIGALVVAIGTLGAAFASTMGDAEGFAKTLTPVRTQLSGLWGDLQKVATGKMGLWEFFSEGNETIDIDISSNSSLLKICIIYDTTPVNILITNTIKSGVLKEPPVPNIKNIINPNIKNPIVKIIRLYVNLVIIIYPFTTLHFY